MKVGAANANSIVLTNRTSKAEAAERRNVYRTFEYLRSEAPLGATLIS
jgi:hypothetical protein